MPPKKSTATNQTTRTNSRKRLSSPTAEASQNSTNSDDENLNQTPNSDNPTNSSSNSEKSDDQVKDDDTVTNDDDSADDAKGEDKGDDKPVEESTGDKKRAGSEPKGHIVRVGEDLHIPATKHDSFAIVDKDVYREIVLRGSNRVSYQLVYTAGTAIPLSKLDQIQ